jgi:hypothetical protein
VEGSIVEDRAVEGIIFGKLIFVNLQLRRNSLLGFRKNILL